VGGGAAAAAAADRSFALAQVTHTGVTPAGVNGFANVSVGDVSATADVAVRPQASVIPTVTIWGPRQAVRARASRATRARRRGTAAG